MLMHMHAQGHAIAGWPEAVLVQLQQNEILQALVILFVIVKRDFACEHKEHATWRKGEAMAMESEGKRAQARVGLREKERNRKEGNSKRRIDKREKERAWTSRSRPPIAGTAHALIHSDYS